MAERSTTAMRVKVGDQNALMRKIERDLQLKGDGGDFHEKVVSAFRSRGASDLSLRAAHDGLQKQFQELQRRHDERAEEVVRQRGVIESHADKIAEQKKMMGPSISIVDPAFQSVFEQNGFPFDAPLPERVGWLSRRIAATSSEHQHVAVPTPKDFHIHLHFE